VVANAVSALNDLSTATSSSSFLPFFFFFFFLFFLLFSFLFSFRRKTCFGVSELRFVRVRTVLTLSSSSSCFLKERTKIHRDHTQLKLNRINFEC